MEYTYRKKRAFMNFKQIELKDLETIRPYFSKLKSRTCDYTTGSMGMWRQYSNIEFALEDGVFYPRMRNKENVSSYLMPIGEDACHAIKTLYDRENVDGKMKFSGIPECYVEDFKNVLDVAEVKEQVIYFDYLYLATDIGEMKGKKYSGQRNQINHFQRNVVSWDYKDIKDVPISDVMDFFTRTYCQEIEIVAETQREENSRVIEVLNNMDIYQMVGGVLYADGGIIGFSLGEIVGDTMFTHIEKADRSYSGSYQMIVQQFSSAYMDAVTYINREEDMGDPGLRTSKQSYHPIELLKKYVIEVG